MAQQNLQGEDGKRCEFDMDQTERGAKAEAEAIEQQDAYKRLGDVVGECHAAWSCYPQEQRRITTALINQADTFTVTDCVSAN